MILQACACQRLNNSYLFWDLVSQMNYLKYDTMIIQHTRAELISILQDNNKCLDREQEVACSGEIQHRQDNTIHQGLPNQS